MADEPPTKRHHTMRPAAIEPPVIALETDAAPPGQLTIEVQAHLSAPYNALLVDTPDDFEVLSFDVDGIPQIAPQHGIHASAFVYDKDWAPLSFGTLRYAGIREGMNVSLTIRNTGSQARPFRARITVLPSPALPE